LADQLFAWLDNELASRLSS